MKLSVQKLYSIEEKQQITDLFANSFPGKPEELAVMFSLMLNGHPDLTTVSVRNDEGEIVSALFLISGIFDRNLTKMTYCNMSYFATNSAYRKGEATASIIKYVTEVVQNDFDLVFGFPRHVMSGYWSRYQFNELTNSGCVALRIKKSELPKHEDLHIRVATPKDAPVLNKIYLSASSNRLINFRRSISKWEYLLRISHLHKSEILISEDSLGQVFGYLVIRHGVILEIACHEGRESQTLTQELLASLDLDCITISLRGALSGFLKIAQVLIDASERVELVQEDLWDFMFFCRDEELKEYFSRVEGSTHATAGSNVAPSSFTILDQY